MKVKIKWHNSLQNGITEVPVLLLQPLIENSIKYGWKENDDPLIINIGVEENDQGVIVRVKDNGQGIESNRLKKIPASGHALANINERLYLNYRKSDLLKIESIYGEGTTVSIFLPVRT
jgi:sensor histidine kinase YesM